MGRTKDLEESKPDHEIMGVPLIPEDRLKEIEAELDRALEFRDKLYKELLNYVPEDIRKVAVEEVEDPKDLFGHLFKGSRLMFRTRDRKTHKIKLDLYPQSVANKVYDFFDSYSHGNCENTRDD